MFTISHLNDQEREGALKGRLKEKFQINWKNFFMMYFLKIQKNISKFCVKVYNSNREV